MCFIYFSLNFYLTAYYSSLIFLLLLTSAFIKRWPWKLHDGLCLTWEPLVSSTTFRVRHFEWVLALLLSIHVSLNKSFNLALSFVFLIFKKRKIILYWGSGIIQIKHSTVLDFRKPQKHNDHNKYVIQILKQLDLLTIIYPGESPGR